MEAEPIETRRLRLRPLRIADADEMAIVLGDARLYAFIGGEPLDRDALAARYARLVRGSADAGEIWLNWIVRIKADRIAIGTVQATVLADPTRASIAWVVGLPWQG